jgi:hypothetical protein
MLSGREHSEAQGAEGDALQGENGMPDGLAHAPHLAVATFADRQLELVAGAAQATSARRSGGTVLQFHAAAQRAQGALGDGSACDAHAVGLGNFVARMREAISERAIVGQQDQAAAVGVEAPHRV